MRIQHNILAMNAYRNYNTNTSALSKNLEKLSSGYKINRAGDDAAGLAISEKMRAQITGLNAAQKNVKDGISLVKTAEGAMQEIQDMLNRMDYLATQSANGTYDDEVDRANLQKEVNSLRSEINRIAESANFNGINLLDGSRAITGASSSTNVEKIISLECPDNLGQLHAAGAQATHAQFSVDLKQAITGATINASGATSFTVKISVAGGSLTVKVSGGTFSKGQVLGADDIDGLTFTIASAAGTRVTLTPTNGTAAAFGFANNSGVITFTQKASVAAVNFDVNMNVSITSTSGSVAFAAAGTDKTQTLSFNCMTIDQKNGVKQTADQLAHGHFELDEKLLNVLKDGGTLKIAEQNVKFDKTKNGTDSANGVIGVKDLLDKDGNLNIKDADTVKAIGERLTRATSGNQVFTVGFGSDGKTVVLQERYDNYKNDGPKLETMDQFHEQVGYSTTSSTAASGGLTLQIGDTSKSYNQLKVSIGDMHVEAMGFDLDAQGNITTNGKSIADIDISKQDKAQEAIDVIRNAINYVSSIRGDLGATQNRLEHTANNLSVMAENIQDAESTIRDTDVAEEMMAYTKNNILVQSAQAMLAQANAVPQGVLQLLG